MVASPTEAYFISIWSTPSPMNNIRNFISDPGFCIHLTVWPWASNGFVLLKAMWKLSFVGKK